jgi:hypothetical protein
MIETGVRLSAKKFPTWGYVAVLMALCLDFFSVTSATRWRLFGSGIRRTSWRGGAEVGLLEIGFEDAQHDAVDAKLFGQRPCVHADDPGNAVFLEPVVERFFRAGVRRDIAQLADDVAPGLGLVRLEAFGADAVVADQGIRLAEDLAVVGGVGDRLRVAYHAGVEDDFPRDFGEGTEPFAGPNAAVF